MSLDYTPDDKVVRVQYALDYLASILSVEADNGSLWWQLISDEILQSSIITLHAAMETLSNKIAHHDESALLINTHIRLTTKALNNEDLCQAAADLEKTFMEKVVPACALTFDFIDNDNGKVLFSDFEHTLFFLFCYQDEIIDKLLKLY